MHLKKNITRIMATKINCGMSHIKILLLRKTYGHIVAYCGSQISFTADQNKGFLLKNYNFILQEKHFLS